MIKLVYCIRKRADVSDEEFHRYWLEQHGPLVRSFAEVTGAKKYIQSHTIEPENNARRAESRGFAPAYDGITEVWWDDLESYQGGADSEARRHAGATLAEDEAKFIDISQSRVFITEEHVIFDL